MKVLLGGEGRTEIGRWAREPAYQSHDSEESSGVVLALLEKLTGASFEVVDGVLWRKIVKFKCAHRDAEHRNVLAIVLKASEMGADIVAFVRDRDGKKDREESIERAIAEAKATFPRIVGGVAVEQTEAWILAMLGCHNSESHRDAKANLREEGISTLEEKLQTIARWDPSETPTDAQSLHQWIARARDATTPPTAQEPD